MLHTRSSTLITPGGQIKDLGSKRIGGYLVKFGGPEETDLEGQFFTKDTDFGPHRKSIALYGHGFDPQLKRRKLDDKAVLSVDEAGVWIESQLAIRDEYEELLYEEGILAGKMGWSSGTASHLVELEKTDSGAEHIKQWWLGLDASITPQPAEPRTLVTPLKSWHVTPVRALGTDAAVKAESLNDRLRQINNDFRAAFRDSDANFFPYVQEVFDSFLITEVDGRYYRLAYERGEDNRFNFAPQRDWAEVVQRSQWVEREEADTTSDLDSEDLAAADLTKQLKTLNNRFSTQTPGTHAETSALAASLQSLNQRMETRHA